MVNFSIMSSQLHIYLWVVSILYMDFGHAFQPGLSELWCTCIGLGQTILKINQHFRVLLMLLHLCCCHYNSTNSFCQILDFWRKSSGLSEDKSSLKALNITQFMCANQKCHRPLIPLRAALLGHMAIYSMSPRTMNSLCHRMMDTQNYCYSCLNGIWLIERVIGHLSSRDFPFCWKISYAWYVGFYCINN